MSSIMTDEKAILQDVISIARVAGGLIMEVYADTAIDVTVKDDGSPVTKADQAANEYIVSHLSRLTPGVPIVAEESVQIASRERLAASEIWLVDPLDGTKEFINHKDDFTVNIGLVRDGSPVLGVVYAPALDVLYYGVRGASAWRQRDTQPPEVVQPAAAASPAIVAVSRSHLNAQTEAWLKALGPHTLLSVGSSLKLCYVADGTAHVYPRLGPQMEWDTAAGDAIVRAAGGMVLDMDGQPLTYNKPDLHTPFFIASGTRLEQ